MADGSFGKRDILLDIAGVTGARVVRDATKGEWVKIKSFEIDGIAPSTGTQGTIIFREESASGNIVYSLVPGNNEVVRQTIHYDDGTDVFKGLYVDALTAGWVAGSTITIHTA